MLLIKFRLSFVRAKPERALLRIGDDKAIVEERAIPLIDPQLNVMYISSNDIDQRINRLKGHSIPYTDFPLRSIVLNEGVASYNLTLINGSYRKNVYFLCFLFVF